MDVHVLGPFRVVVDGTDIDLSPVERHLIALLAAERDGLDAERLADQLWPDRLPNTWKASLRNNISRLNRKVAATSGDGRRLISVGSTTRRLLAKPSAVDLWRLRAWATDPGGIGAANIEADPALLAGAPFSGCEISPILREATQMVTAARQDIVEAWAREREELSHQLLVALRRLCRDDPFNEPLAESVAELHLAAGLHHAAADLLAELETEGILSEANAELLAKLRRNLQPTVLSADVRRATVQLRSPAIARLSRDPMAGRDELLDELLEIWAGGGSGVLIHGDSGIGKTRLAAELAGRIATSSGCHSAYVVADQQVFGSLQPFLDAFSDLGQRVRPHLERLHDPNVQAQCRQAILDFLSSTFAGRPLCLVVDDVQWLDDQSSGLITSLCRTGLDAGLFVVGVGRGAERSSRWAGWLSDLGRTGLPQVKLEPLGRDGMLALIRAELGDLEQLGAGVLADQILELSSGIPNVAHWLLGRVDPRTLEIATGDVVGTGYATIVNQLEPDLRRFGALGSILGHQFDLEDLGRLGRFAPEENDRLIEAAVASGLVTDLPIPGQYRFAHILAAEAFERTLPVSERVKSHARAFDLFDDPIGRARHAGPAAPVIGSERAAAALVAAARAHFTEGNFRETATALQEAMRLDRAAVGLADRVMHLEALERTGIRATGERDAVVTEAIASDAPSFAFRAAKAGLPDNEALEGDPERVRVLQRVLAQVDPADLTADERVELHLRLSRQLTLTSRLPEAVEQAELAAGQATTPEQAAECWLARRVVDGLGRRATGPWPTLADIDSEVIRLRIGQARVIDTIASGGSALDWDRIVDHAESIPIDRYPHLHWFSRMFLATALTDRGRLDEAREVAERAHRDGLRDGLRIAEGTYQTQLFIWELHQGTHGRIYPLVAGGGADDVAANIIFDAGVAACHVAFAEGGGTDEAGRAERRAAIERVAPICEQAERSSLGLGAIGIMARAIAATGDRRLIGWADERLTDESDGYVLVASAAANLGPSTRLRAMLQTDRRRAIELGEQAVATADRDRLPLWQVIGRLELAGVLDGRGDRAAATILREAKDLASTPWLDRLVGRHPAGGYGVA